MAFEVDYAPQIIARAPSEAPHEKPTLSAKENAARKGNTAGGGDMFRNPFCRRTFGSEEAGERGPTLPGIEVDRPAGDQPGDHLGRQIIILDDWRRGQRDRGE